MRAGGVLLLNGTSSSGKGTIARAIQTQDDAWLHFGLDRMLEGVPASLRVSADPADGAPDGPGWTVPFRNGVLVGAPRLGPVALQLLGGMYRAAAAMAGAGDLVILDDVIYDRRVLVLAAEGLKDTPTLFV
jgi:chloramphenicol 3-O phosphotransferase